MRTSIGPRLVVDGPGGPQPSVAGLLVIGTERALKRSVPSASAVFQVMKGTSPKVNTDPFFLPLVDMLPRIGALMEPWNPDHEVMSGLVHVNLPDFDHQAFRETQSTRSATGIMRGWDRCGSSWTTMA